MTAAAAKDKALIGAAGVFHVTAELSLRGMIALPTIRNTAGYDIIVTNRDGSKHANIQVKTSSQRPTFLPICWRIDSVKNGPDDYYVLLRRNETNYGFEGYMLAGGEMKEKLTVYDALYTENGLERKFSLCLCLYVDEKLHISKEDIEGWQKQWKDWRLE
ncbi:MAG: hypothetical protein ABSC47_09610 [Terracidiphilus sp.]|jgi:hypothetical protein